MANLPILRTHCDVEYYTPGDSIRIMPINCAKSDSETWPWKYLFVKTLGTDPAITTDGFERAPASFTVEGETFQGSSSSGQVVLRGVFAYIATDPINVSIECELNMEGSQSVWNPNYYIEALLEEPSGDTVQTFFSVQADYKSETVTLPATVCPKILWIQARVQPSGGPLVDIPSCSGSITVSLF